LKLAYYYLSGTNNANLNVASDEILRPAWHISQDISTFVPSIALLSFTTYSSHPRSMISKATPTSALSLAIIGGGLAGLTLSIGLSKFAVKHTIYESASRFSDIGAGISTGKNAIAALALIDPRIIECYDRCSTSAPAEKSDLPHMSFRWGMAERHRDGLE
jgi:hypothetical protein